MNVSNDQMLRLRTELNYGAIQAAYRGLLDFILGLRTHFQKTFPEFDVPGNVYQGYMDMTYFSIIPPALKQRKLKIAVVFVYETFRFEIWLSGYNRQVQAQYWRQLRDNDYQRYRLVADPLKADSILEHVLVENPGFEDPDKLTRLIESGVREFILDMEKLVFTLGQ